MIFADLWVWFNTKKPWIWLLEAALLRWPNRSEEVGLSPFWGCLSGYSYHRGYVQVSMKWVGSQNVVKIPFHPLVYHHFSCQSSPSTLGYGGFHDVPCRQTLTYCGWASEILHQLKTVVNIPLFLGFQPSEIGGAGFRWPIHRMVPVFVDLDLCLLWFRWAYSNAATSLDWCLCVVYRNYPKRPSFSG